MRGLGGGEGGGVTAFRLYNKSSQIENAEKFIA